MKKVKIYYVIFLFVFFTTFDGNSEETKNKIFFGRLGTMRHSFMRNSEDYILI